MDYIDCFFRPNQTKLLQLCFPTCCDAELGHHLVGKYPNFKRGKTMP